MSETLKPSINAIFLLLWTCKDYSAHLEVFKNTKDVCVCSTLWKLVFIGLWAILFSAADDCMSVISDSVDHQVSLHHQQLLQQLYAGSLSASFFPCSFFVSFIPFPLPHIFFSPLSFHLFKVVWQAARMKEKWNGRRKGAELSRELNLIHLSPGPIVHPKLVNTIILQWVWDWF